MSFSARQLTSYSCMRPAAEAGCGGAGFSELVTLASVIGSSVNPTFFRAGRPFRPSLPSARAVGATESRRHEDLTTAAPRGGVSRDG